MARKFVRSSLKKTKSKRGRHVLNKRKTKTGRKVKTGRRSRIGKRTLKGGADEYAKGVVLKTDGEKIGPIKCREIPGNDAVICATKLSEGHNTDAYKQSLNDLEEAAAAEAAAAAAADGEGAEAEEAAAAAAAAAEKAAAADGEGEGEGKEEK